MHDMIWLMTGCLTRCMDNVMYHTWSRATFRGFGDAP